MSNSFVHLINPVALPPDSALFKAQQVTFKAIENAWNNKGKLSVELRTAQFEEDHDIIPSFFTSTPDLRRSILDDRLFTLKRKLPFLADILENILKYSNAEYAIFTNVDIIPSVYFYTAIHEIIKMGNKAFTVNRRTVAKYPNTPDKLDEILAQDGKPHPGHDCFIFPRKWIEQFDVGRIVIGVPWIGFILLANVACIARGLNVYKDLRLTRHLGDDTQWLSEEHLQYRNYNAKEALSILNRLQKKYGAFNREGYLGQHVTLAEKQVEASRLGKAPVIKKDAKNKLIFSINSGRCGSEYLKSILGTGINVNAFHEKYPYMEGKFLEMVMGKPLQTSFKERLVKVDAIKKIINYLPSGNIYAETNHMFIKTFYDVTLDSFPHDQITVVILRRDLVKVLKSFITMGYFSNRNLVWPQWIHRVPSENSILKPYKSFNEMDAYDRAISYLLDIEAKAQAFKENFSECKIVEVNLEELQDYRSVSAFLAEIEIESTPYTREIAGTKVNIRQSRKEEFNIKTSEEYCKERIVKYLSENTEYGVVLPLLPHFKENL